MSIRILIADDHQILRDGLRNVFEKHADIEVVGEARDGHEAIALVKELSPDVVVMDITMPNLNGFEATRAIKAIRSSVCVVALSMHSGSRFVSEMLRAGASGFLLKESATAELLQAIRAVVAGKSYLSPAITGPVLEDYIRSVPIDGPVGSSVLSPREREVLQLVAEGQSTKAIAAKLHLSIKTIDAHRAHIMEKLQIDSVAGLTKFAISEGLTSPEP